MSATTNRHSDGYEEYFHYLKNISALGHFYKRYISSPILFRHASSFGQRIVEVGSGSGAGVLGTFPAHVVGLEINPFAVEYCKSIGLQASLIKEDGIFPLPDGAFDACVLDNVLEHIEDPRQILDECWRITQPQGGLIVAVPGIRGFARDPDHKMLYEENKLRQLDYRWQLEKIFSIPFFVRNERLSKTMRQYCLVAVYRKSS